MSGTEGDLRNSNLSHEDSRTNFPTDKKLGKGARAAESTLGFPFPRKAAEKTHDYEQSITKKYRPALTQQTGGNQKTLELLG